MANFIIFSFRYNDDIGGIVVQHKLCHLLNQQGQNAFLWPNYKPVFNWNNPIKSAVAFLRYFRKSLHKTFATKPGWNTPIAEYKDLKDAIVIYPEIVDGNPLQSEKVVRWLLHKPGFHTKKVNYGTDELYFFYLKAYIENLSFQVDDENLLYIPNNREETYRQTNFGNREGSCYILRKGKNRPIVHDLSDSILIDGKSHQEIAKIFNDVTYCISYDTYTMFSMYAAMCGCISVVIPEEGVSKEEWLPEEERRYGIAYGFENIPEAIETHKYLLPRFQQEEAETVQAIERFIFKCAQFFSSKS
ncbi:MAG: hypothetical protein PHW64_02520 [Sulfuricurvum sp.]|nr:hypothetical protein [Sulfuricurvum sp.]